MERTPPSRTTVSPQSPTRQPPRTVTKPEATLSSAVWAEARVAFSSTVSRSRGVTVRLPTGLSPSGMASESRRPARRRSSSAPARRPSGRASTSERISSGSSAAAFSKPSLSLMWTIYSRPRHVRPARFARV